MFKLIRHAGQACSKTLKLLDSLSFSFYLILATLMEEPKSQVYPVQENLKQYTFPFSMPIAHVFLAGLSVSPYS